MKILSANKFYHIFGGSDRYFFELNQLHEQHGHEIVPFAMSHPKNLDSTYQNYFVSQVKYWEPAHLTEKIKAGGRVLYSREAQRKMRELIEATEPDIAHIHLIYHQISPSILPILKENNIPIVQTLHDYKPICPTYSFLAHDEICERCQGRYFFHATLQRCNHGSLTASIVNTAEMYLHHALGWYDLPDMYIAPSNFLRQKMIDYGLPDSKVIHIPNFVNTKKYLASDQSEDYFIYIGRLHKIKGLKTLLLAMHQLKTKNNKLLLIGDGPQKAELLEMKRTLQLDNVEFLGHLAAEQLRSVINGAKFNVLPSEVYENCPMSVLECMAMGKPTIGARIGGIPELIEEGVNGVLFESGNVDDLAEKINFMLSDSQRLQMMGRESRKKAEETYSAEIHYQEMMKIYEQVLP